MLVDDLDGARFDVFIELGQGYFNQPELGAQLAEDLIDVLGCTGVLRIGVFVGLSEGIGDPSHELLYLATQLVDDLTDVFLTSGGDMRQMLRTIVSHPAFWESRESPRLAHPFQYAIRLMRMSRWDAPWQVGEYLDRSGAGLFDRATPDGYPEEDSAYADSNALIQRWSLAQSAKWPIISRVPSGVRYARDHENAEWEQLVVDALAVAVTGRVLSDDSNAAALGLLRATEGSSDQRTLTLATFVAQLPEASLR